MRGKRISSLFVYLLVAVLIVTPLQAFAEQKISAGFYHALYLDDDGTLWAWGDNGYGQVGNGTTEDQLTPEDILSNVETMSGGGLFSLALTSDNALWAWGSNHYGQLGTAEDITPEEEVSTATAVKLLEDVAAVSGGGWHSLALKNDGTVWAWGRNDSGQLGIDSTEHQPLPVQVKGPSGTGFLENIVAISAGGWHSMALADDGTVYVWGGNEEGQLGDGSTASSLTPKVLSGLDHVEVISAGFFHNLVVHSDGTISSWGDNQYGQLGDGSTEARPTPISVPDIHDVKAVSSGHYHSLALKEDGTVWAWGDNIVGQLGLGTNEEHHTPVRIPSLNDISMITAGGYFNLALQEDGSGWSWGWNEFGQVGDGTTSDRWTPVKFLEPDDPGGPTTPPTSPGPGSGGGGSGGSGGSGSSARTSLIDVQLFINDVLHEEIAHGTIRNTIEQRILTVTLDEDELADELEKVGREPTVVIKVNTVSDNVTSLLSGEMIRTLAHKNTVLEVRTPIGNYILPAEELLAEDALESLSGNPAWEDVIVHITISKVGQEVIRLAEEADEDGPFAVIGSPLEFDVTVDHGDESVHLDTFFSFVRHEIPVPEGVDSDEVTTAVVLLEDGTVRHVPTSKVIRNGTEYASASSLSNSYYVLVSNSASFADVQGHWAQNELNDFASRMIVFGVNEEQFMPNNDMTRAELVATIVRAMGITVYDGSSGFVDIDGDEWYAEVLAKAEMYGLINGYPDGTFQPNEPVTRQEAIVMVYRAMALSGLDTHVDSDEVDTLLSQFTDGASVDDWAKADVAAVIKNGLVIGSHGQLMPDKYITRAEKSVIVWRMLRKADLID